MADHLGVDPDGLRSGASRSDGLAASLTAQGAGGSSGSQPSHAGVSAILAAAQAAREQQADRVSGQANTLRSNASQYDSTDVRSASDIAKAM
ncbi:Protein of uncharacterised function (DUF2580) [Mycobacteroides abscessus subsp. massiliense]|uniref:type VII secretion target n=1 Tax=Mycobacteroides abscessus TaxID=36809 RepID=UPI0009A725F8|nr:type VII secretion target [Mycobacteroides abscessus]SKU86081.1 Protein of uncharacterised function (DUF2580) [Mycobacteroides abscessus subsp. massiliense]SKU94742.1 Protein of uncharacterised function (DUF2580) [Mycobacteroides abscessus subsp. massiliense]